MNRNLFSSDYDHASQLREMLQPSTRKEVISSRAGYVAKISTRRIHDKKKAQFRKAHPDADRGIHRFIGVEPKLTGEKLESVNRNAAALSGLSARTPEDWLARIKKLEEGHPALARACACFVYWDYISLRADFAKWTQFERWAMSRMVPVECFDLIAALIWLGWTPFEADMRVNGSEGIVELRIAK